MAYYTPTEVKDAIAAFERGDTDEKYRGALEHMEGVAGRTGRDAERLLKENPKK